MKARFQQHACLGRQLVASLSLFAVCAGQGALAQEAEEPSTALRNGTIGYVLTDMIWSTYETPGAKTECPKGVNLMGPREQFEVRHPQNRKRTVIDTQLAYEARTWHPTQTEDGFVFHEAVGPSYGLNLDGRVDPDDFTHPDGTPGIDNQLYRATGCLNGYRTDGLQWIFLKMAIPKQRFTRFMVELSEVDDLRNDPDVKVTIYRGLDRLLTDATGEKIVPGGSQRIDTRWGASLIQQVDGQIVDGVLTTKPTAQMIIPWNSDTGVPTLQILRDMRVQLKITPTSAEGVIGGYTDVETWYASLIRADSTHHLSNGQVAAPTLYNVLKRLADAYPDPDSGANTAISSSLDAKFTQVFIQHPEGPTAKAALLRSLSERQTQTAALAD